MPLEREQEYVLDRDHVYELNGDDARTLATVGVFRIVPERDLRDGDDAPGGIQPTAAWIMSGGWVMRKVGTLTLGARAFDARVTSGTRPL